MNDSRDRPESHRNADRFFKSSSDTPVATTSASRQITDNERQARDTKTARLKAARETAEAVAPMPTKKR